MAKIIYKLLGLVLVINLVYVTLGVVKYGSQHVDAYGIWLLKAKSWTVLRENRYSYSHQQYPVLLPALMAGSTRLTGNLNTFLYLYPLIYAAILLVLYKLLRLDRLGSTQALVSVAVASFMGPLMAQGGRLHAGLADIWITLLVGLGLVAARKKSLVWLTVIVMIASQIKTEGIFLMALFLGVPVEWRRKLGWMLLAAMPFGWWQWQVRAWGLPSDIGFAWPGLGELGRRLVVILGLVGKEMLNWRNWYVIWPITLLSALGGCSPLKRENITVIGWISLGFVGVYLLSRLDPGQYVSSSIDRIMLQWLPLWWLMLDWPVRKVRQQDQN